jgi:hypothetical protein
MVCMVVNNCTLIVNVIRCIVTLSTTEFHPCLAEMC